MISVLGAGAFGTSMAIALAQGGREVVLWARDPDLARNMQETRKSGAKCPGFDLPDSLRVTSDLSETLAPYCLLAIPTQNLAQFLDALPSSESTLIACCKGVDKSTGLGPVATISAAKPDQKAAILTGPSFAVDIANNLPTALVLATEHQDDGKQIQTVLNRPKLRIYRTTDVVGAELGGALKNVVALAAGMAMGAGLGESARASVIARGFSELSRYAMKKGAKAETLQGLAGLGDLVLTCTSQKSRNFEAGFFLGKEQTPDTTKTIEGLYTAGVVANDAKELSLDLPLITALADVISGKLDIASAIETLLARPVDVE